MSIDISAGEWASYVWGALESCSLSPLLRPSVSWAPSPLIDPSASASRAPEFAQLTLSLCVLELCQSSASHFKHPRCLIHTHSDSHRRRRRGKRAVGLLKHKEPLGEPWQARTALNYLYLIIGFSGNLIVEVLSVKRVKIHTHTLTSFLLAHCDSDGVCLISPQRPVSSLPSNNHPLLISPALLLLRLVLLLVLFSLSFPCHLQYLARNLTRTQAASSVRKYETKLHHR